jgi:UDP-N-acetylmuramate--alanine ligase
MSVKHYYFIGIGGIGMSGLAKILLAEGNTISGSDPVPNNETSSLKKLGADIRVIQVADNITEGIDRVIISAAIPNDNAELIRARELGISITKRPELLNEIITKKKAIAVTGTHGKTTVSSMLSEALIAAKMDPVVVVGAEIESIGSNSRVGNGDYAVAEVCEYQRAFLDVHPYAAVITNVDADHLDCYKDINDIKEAFIKFVGQINPEGFLVYCGDDNNASAVASTFPGKTISYGLKGDNTIIATNVIIDSTHSNFTISGLGEFEISVPGRHNILNALACISVASEIGADMDSVRASLATFRGAERRFQLLGVYLGAPVIDDYAHHPTEITATLAAARERYPEKRLVVVFQPHQHSRTKLLVNDFVSALSLADRVIMPEIYAVRDTPEDIAAISSKDIVNLINTVSPDKAIYFPDFDQTTKYLEQSTDSNDVIMTVGAGPVNKIGLELVEK